MSPTNALIFVAAGVLALISLFSVWFQPSAPGVVANGETVHAWDDGRLGVIGPLSVILMGILAALTLRADDPGDIGGRDVAKPAAFLGLVAIAMPVVAYVFVGFQFEVTSCSTGFTDFGCSTKDLRDVAGASYGPQTGFVLCIVAGVISLVGAGVLRASPMVEPAVVEPVRLRTNPATSPTTDKRSLSELADEVDRARPRKPTLSEVAADMTRRRAPAPSEYTSPTPQADRAEGIWAADPYRRHELRYFDGRRWTDHVSDAGVPAVDAW